MEGIIGSHIQSAHLINNEPLAANKTLGDPLSLPRKFLEKPTTNVIVSRIKFEESAVPEFSGFYATVLDNVLTSEECSILIQAVDNRSEDDWEQIVGNDNGDGRGFLRDNRLCKRIMWDSSELVSKIWKRITDKVPELQQLKDWPEVTCAPPQQHQETWNLVRLNERMRFMKYSHGEYFKPHYDCAYAIPERRERSYFTLHLTLNGRDGAADGKDAFEGGATTFYAPTGERRVEVQPKAGRALLFQHASLNHAGEEVIHGTKYTMRSDLMYTTAES